MRVPIIITASILLSAAQGARAQQPNSTELRTIQVIGSGKATTAPDVANIEYWVAGEGRTSDEAGAALAAKEKAIRAGLSGLLGGRTAITSGNVIVIEAHDPACDGANGYNSRPRLATGACAVTGYIASMQGSVRTSAIGKAGTAAGLAARLGAKDARLQSFQLSDDGNARRAATADAIADARRRAEAIAAGAGAKLGPVVTIRDQNSQQYSDFAVSATGLSNFAPPPPPPPAPIVIEVSAKPIETRAQVYITYSILP